MILDILSYPDPSLRAISEPVRELTPEIRQLAADMLETMYDAKGVGLAAPQVGRPLRMLVMDPAVAYDGREPRVVINPELELLGEKIVSEQEGCLSVPLNYRADVPRHSMARLRGMDLEGRPIDEILQGLPAIIIQHETDHLDGKLFIDRLSHLKRSMYDGKVKKWLKAQKEE